MPDALSLCSGGGFLRETNVDSIHVGQESADDDLVHIAAQEPHDGKLIYVYAKLFLKLTVSFNFNDVVSHYGLKFFLCMR